MMPPAVTQKRFTESSIFGYRAEAFNVKESRDGTVRIPRGYIPGRADDS